MTCPQKKRKKERIKKGSSFSEYLNKKKKLNTVRPDNGKKTYGSGRSWGRDRRKTFFHTYGENKLFSFERHLNKRTRNHLLADISGCCE